MFGVFYLNGSGFLLLGNLENYCIWFKKKKEKGAVSERCEMRLVMCGRGSAGLLVCVCWHGMLHSDEGQTAQLTMYPTSVLLTHMVERVEESPVPMGQDGARETGGPAEEAGSHNGQPSCAFPSAAIPT